MPADASHIAKVVSPALLKFLRRRYRLLAAEHDDLIQEALTGLLEWTTGHSKTGASEDEWLALSIAILKRRIADRFRKAEALVSLDELGDIEAFAEQVALRDPSAPIEDIVQYRRLLATCLEIISRMKPEDQTLLMESAISAEDGRPMSSTERRHLSRLRQRLKVALEKDFGVSAKKMFRS